jgi:hypothetical protein
MGFRRQDDGKTKGEVAEGGGTMKGPGDGENRFDKLEKLGGAYVKV